MTEQQEKQCQSNNQIGKFKRVFVTIVLFCVILFVAKFLGTQAGRQAAMQKIQQESITIDAPTGYNPAIENQSSSVSLSQSSSSQEPSMTANDSKFTKLKLPLGVSVEVPKNWRIIDGDLNTAIEIAGKTAMNLSGVELPKNKKVNLFRANSVPQSTYAGIAINATDSEPDDYKLWMNASEEEIKELSPQVHEMLQQGFSSQNMKIIEFYGVHREFIGRHPALVTEYKRSGPKGAVIVQMTRLFLGEKEISLNLSYRETEAEMWKPITQYIRKSLKVE